MRIGVVIPAYNEARGGGAAGERGLSTPPPQGCMRRGILVDDGSSDGTRPLVEALAKREGVEAVFHQANQGKGAALRSGFAAALGGGAELVLVHDADMEYDPADHESV